MSELHYYPAVKHDVPGRMSEHSGQEEVQDLQAGMDFRLPQYRREVFLRFYEFHLRYRAHPGCVYFMLPWFDEQIGGGPEASLWRAFINGNTQNPVTTWLIYLAFPDHNELGDLGELRNWFNANWARLDFDTDRRYQKKEFVKSVECYLKRLRGGPQASFFNRSSDPFENFREIWGVVRGYFHSFGRLATFSYLEYLRIAGVNIDCDDLFLEDMDGSKSHRNGLAKVLGRDDLDWHDSNPTGFAGKYTGEVLGWLRREAQLLRADAQYRFYQRDFAGDVGYFTLESTLCTFKSWFRPNRRYPGVYLDMHHDRVLKAEKAWPELSFDTFWSARRHYLPPHLRLEDRPGDPGVKPQKQNHFRETGQVIMMDREWPCFENDFNRRHG